MCMYVCRFVGASVHPCVHVCMCICLCVHVLVCACVCGTLGTVLKPLPSPSILMQEASMTACAEVPADVELTCLGPFRPTVTHAPRRGSLSWSQVTEGRGDALPEHLPDLFFLLGAIFGCTPGASSKCGMGTSCCMASLHWVLPSLRCQCLHGLDWRGLDCNSCRAAESPGP